MTNGGLILFKHKPNKTVAHLLHEYVWDDGDAQEEVEEP